MATRAMRRKALRNQPTIVIGCAIAKETRRAMFKRRDKFAMRASASDTALTAMSLRIVVS